MLSSSAFARKGGWGTDDPAFPLIPGAVFQDGTISFALATIGVIVSLEVLQMEREGNEPPDPIKRLCNLIGSSFADQLSGNADDNLLSGGQGDDTLSGGDGDDTLIGGDGRDTASYATASSAVRVSLALQDRSQDTGGAGDDRLSSMENLLGSAYADSLSGDGGDNRIDGGGGDDRLAGGLGVDTAVYASAAAGVRVSLATSRIQNTGAGGRDVLAGFENLEGSAFGDGLRGNAASNRLIGGGGADTLIASAGNDSLDGGEGSDTVSYAGFTTAISVGAFGGVSKGALGSDSLRFIDTVIGGSAADGDTVDHSAAVAPVSGTSTDLSTGQVVVLGAVAPLPVRFEVRQFEHVIGSPFADTIIGNAASNRLSGGGGADTFVIRSVADSSPAAPDSLVDFSEAEGDRLDLRAIGGLRWIGLLPTPGAVPAAGELGYRRDAALNRSTLIATSGSAAGAADLLVQLDGVTALSADAFWL